MLGKGVRGRGRGGGGGHKIVWEDSPLIFLTTSLFLRLDPLSSPLPPPLWLLSTFFGARSYAKLYLHCSLHGQLSWGSCIALSCPPSKVTPWRLNAFRRVEGRHLIRRSARKLASASRWGSALRLDVEQLWRNSMQN